MSFRFLAFVSLKRHFCGLFEDVVTVFAWLADTNKISRGYGFYFGGCLGLTIYDSSKSWPSPPKFDFWICMIVSQIYGKIFIFVRPSNLKFTPLDHLRNRYRINVALRYHPGPSAKLVLKHTLKTFYSVSTRTLVEIKSSESIYLNHTTFFFPTKVFILVWSSTE